MHGFTPLPSVVLEDVVQKCGDDGRDDDPEHLVPVKVRDAPQLRLERSVQARKQRSDDGCEDEQVPPPLRFRGRLLRVVHRVHLPSNWLALAHVNNRLFVSPAVSAYRWAARHHL